MFSDPFLVPLPMDNGQMVDYAMALFHYQAERNPVYRQYLQAIRRSAAEVISIDQIPYLPIGFYKTHLVTSRPGAVPEAVFQSSGTTGQTASQNPVYNLTWYDEVAQAAFERQWGPLAGYSFLSMLPRYRDRAASSLVRMVHHFANQAEGADPIQAPAHIGQLGQLIHQAAASGRRPVLFAVTHALVSLRGQTPCREPFILIETGGMKGQGPELTRPELHELLRELFPQATVLSEYGMTELCSQGYTSQSYGLDFALPPWMCITLRDPTDPLDTSTTRRRGVVNVMDLANRDTCAFIATDDLAERTEAGIRILGRMDYADLRGCNLLVQ